MNCSECKRFANFANTSETNIGLCKYNYEMVNITSECVFTPKPYTCKDCDHFANDYACLTADENDSAENCSGFVDIQEEVIYNILGKWKIRGFDISEKLNAIVDRFNSEFEIPFQKKD